MGLYSKRWVYYFQWILRNQLIFLEPFFQALIQKPICCFLNLTKKGANLDFRS